MKLKKDHIDYVVSSARCSQDIIRQLQEDLTKQSEITVSHDYERSSVQRRIANLEAIVQQKDRTIETQQANHDASRGALVKTCNDEITRLNIAGENERVRLTRDAAISASKLKFFTSPGGDDDPNRRNYNVTTTP